MADFQEIWIEESESDFNEWDDIDSDTFYGTVGSLLRGDSVIVGGASFQKSIASFQSSVCFLGSTCPDCPDPEDAEPPDNVYGREYLALNLRMVRGDTYKFDAQILLHRTPVDLTGGTVKMTAKWSLSAADGSAVFQKTSSPGGGIVVTDAAQGQITVTIASSNTSSLPAKKVELPYDIQFVDSSGAVYTVLYGTLVIVPDATTTNT